MRNWQAAVLSLLAWTGTALCSRHILTEVPLQEQIAATEAGVAPKGTGFDPAATATLDPTFLTQLTGDNDTALEKRQVELNMTSPGGKNLTRKTAAQVNREAPIYKLPLRGNRTVAAKPQLTVNNSGVKKSRGLDDKPVHSMQSAFDPQIVGPIAQGGDTLELLVGVRVATPGWGSGFNFCVDRYFGTFPKIGIVVPNPIAWILPELQTFPSSARVILDLPVPRGGNQIGSRIAPTSDGFVFWLPSIQPVQISDFAFRYGIQVTQVFGVDFGFGWAQTTCGIDFVRV